MTTQAPIARNTLPVLYEFYGLQKKSVCQCKYVFDETQTSKRKKKIFNTKKRCSCGGKEYSIMHIDLLETLSIKSMLYM